MQQYLDAYETHKADATRALALFRSWCERDIPRVPEMDTVMRLAWRIACGRTVEEAAAREYVYRWSILFNCSPRNADRVFGAPHTLGM